MPHDDALTIGQLAENVVAKVASTELPVFTLVSDAFFTRPSVRRATADSLLGASRRGQPASLDPETTALVTQVVLLILNAVVADRLSKAVDKRAGSIQSWRAKRRLSRALKHAQAPHGARTPVVRLSETDVHAVGEVCRFIAMKAGLPAELAHRVANLLVASLTEPLPADTPPTANEQPAAE